MLSLKAEFAIRQRGGQVRRPKLQNISAPAPIAPPPPSGTGAVPIRSKRLNYIAKKAGATGAKATVSKATGKTVRPKVPLTTPIQEAEKKAEAKAAYQNKLDELRPKPTPATPPTPVERGTAKGEEVTAKKAKVAADEKDALYDKYGGRQSGNAGGGFNIPLVTPAATAVGNTIRDKVVNPVARGLIGRDMDAGEVRGTLAALTLAPAAIGGFLYYNHKTKEAEKEKQAQAQAHRDKVAEIIARRNLIREERGIDPDSLQAQQAEKNRLDLEERKFDFEQKKLKASQPPERELQPRLGYNHFNSPAKQAEFIFGRPKPQGLDWRKGAAVAVGGYGLLSGLNKKRNEDALRINKIKDKEDRAAALDYYNSLQYNVDNVITNVPTALGLSNIVPDTLAHPLIAPAPEPEKEKRNKPRWTNYRTQAAYSQPEPKQSADFFLPLIAPVIGIAGAGYGLYRRKKEAQKKDEVLEAEKLAALDRIKDPELRAGLLSKARGQLIDDTSRSQLVDSALSGDYKSALGIGLKKINFDNK